MSIIEQIKAEIERLYGENHDHADRWDMGFDSACEKMLDFIDSLESGKPMNQDGLEDEYKDYVENDPVYSRLVNRNAGLVIARHFYDLGCRRTAEKYDEIEYTRQRAEESPLPEDTVLFNKGVEEGKRLMMEEAVEISYKGGTARVNGEEKPFEGGTVRVIVLPNEDEK